LRPWSRLVAAGAALWGFAEATLFYIVPDVLLSTIAQTSLKRALAAALAAMAGALAGGALLYGFASADPDAARALMLEVPGVSPALAERVAGLIGGGILTGLIAGSLSGAPYKLFAVEAAAAGVPLSAFLLASLPARLLRFALAALASWFVFARLLGGLALRTRRWLLAGFWLVFYAGYFAAMGL
jgi:membrane protein YqaA with SNARE-associated domain